MLRRRAATLLAVALATVLVSACGRRGAEPAASEGEIVTEEVPLPPDAMVDPSTDQQEVRRQEVAAGVFPSDAPDELPVYPGSSLIDFGRDEAGGFLLLLTSDGAGQAAARYARQLAAAGWERGDGDRWRQGDAEVTVTVTPARGTGSEIRVGYR